MTVVPSSTSLASGSMRIVICSASGSVVGRLNPRLELAEKLVLLERLDVEQHDRAVAKQNRRPAAADADRQRPAAQPLRRAEGPQVDPLADEQRPRGEFAGLGAQKRRGHRWSVQRDYSGALADRTSRRCDRADTWIVHCRQPSACAKPIIQGIRSSRLHSLGFADSSCPAVTFLPRTDCCPMARASAAGGTTTAEAGPDRLRPVPARLPPAAGRPRLLLRAREPRRADGPFDLRPSTGFCIDPIEKKPLNQFYPGTSVLSFGTAGCNLGCKFCQNWSISKSREIEQLSENASPDGDRPGGAQARLPERGLHVQRPGRSGPSMRSTRPGPAAKSASSGRRHGRLHHAAARPAFYEYMDAANVDLKGFTEQFYQHLTLSHLEPVKETLPLARARVERLDRDHQPDHSARKRLADELKAMCDWILEALGPNVPVHFTAFHPDFRMKDRERTPAETLLAAYEIATRAGPELCLRRQHPRSARSKRRTARLAERPLIERVGYKLRLYALDGQSLPALRHDDSRPLRRQAWCLGQPPPAGPDQPISDSAGQGIWHLVRAIRSRVALQPFLCQACHDHRRPTKTGPYDRIAHGRA